jgi:thioredoxin reductase (NADPH)
MIARVDRSVPRALEIYGVSHCRKEGLHMPENDQPTYDVIVIGAGPAGCAAAIYAARARLKTLLIDRAKLGGSLAVAPQVANYPGVPKPLAGAELARIMKQQAADFGAEYLQAPVMGVDLDREVKQVFTADGVRQGKAVIIATGAMGRGARVPGEEQFVGRGVSYCATCDAAFFQGAVVAVVGSSEEAADDALRLARFARQVVLAMPGATLTVSDEARRAVEAEPKIELLPRRRLIEIRGDEQVRAIVLNHVAQPPSAVSVEETLAVDGVFIYLAGNKPVTDFLADALEVSESGCIVTNHLMATAAPGVFAAGDVRCSEFRQAITAAADGAIAAMSADHYVNRRESLRPSR